MKRRTFIAGLGGAAAWPLVARGQQRAMPIIGYLSSASVRGATVAAFRQGLREAGYIEGQNVAIEFRSADGQYDRLPILATDLVRRQVALIAAMGNANSAQAAKAATETIPIVFANGGPPIKLGLVSSLNRPGGNVTGVTFLNSDLVSKRLELLREVVPNVNLIAILTNPNNPNFEFDRRTIENSAQTLGRQLLVLKASTENEIETAFLTLAKEQAGGLLTGTDAFIAGRRDQIVALAAKHFVPAIYNNREFADAGGLMSYGSSLNDAFRRAGIYAGRILGGTNPADLPVQQAVKVELVINLKAAKALGIAFPLSLLGRADEVIE